MDLLRRNSAGELSELVGEAALSYDRNIRIHQFRKRAEASVARLKRPEMLRLNAYTAGVNAGLAALSSPPFEYRLLQTQPTVWQPADSMLTLYSMYLDLQPQWNERERSLAVMKDLLPDDWFRFLTPAGGEWDSPIQGEAYQWEPFFPDQPLAELQAADERSQASASELWQYKDTIEIGSNNWSVSGNLTDDGAGMVADDMHLGLSVPNIWYRASWTVAGADRRITGATLPGAPAMVVGSNEHIAWGFTNSNGDFHDTIILQTNAEETEYLTPEGWQPFTVDNETVMVKGAEPVVVPVKSTRWGPVIGNDHFGRLLAMRWVAHDPEGANLDLTHMETADTVYDALTVAATSGVPGQNLNVVDVRGNQAWTIMGRLPRRFGFTEAGILPSEPADWSTGDLGWNGYMSASEYPTVVNPDSQRIWTANARIVSDELLDKVGRSDYALGARQQQIEKGLFAQEQFSERDFLDIALDDRALFLQRWQRLLLAVLENDESSSARSELADYVAQWEGRASKTSVGYLAVKRFRERVINHTAGAVYRNLESASNVFWPERVDNFLEYPVWALVTQQPEQHVPLGFKDWDDFMISMVDETLQIITSDGEPLSDQTWGKVNTLSIRHPLSDAVPLLSRWLDMPAEPMDGDTYMPRVQRPSNGASERMVVTPGQEEDGIFHMPVGQSGHPLSPYYDRGHRDWVEGRPSRFMPGPTQWRMTLEAM
jgi:penicillin amidase